jgi:type VI secretion system protein ImpL
LSVENLLRADDGQIDELAKKLRARADEVMARLEMVLPIYVMFTKTDLVAGFVEFWGDLNKTQRAQAWGATFALDDARLSEPARAFESEFDTLLGVLHARMLERLARETVQEVRAKILQFPIEFESMRGPIGRFLDELCRHNPYHESPILRGFYFSSGTQTGQSIDRVLANMSRGFNFGVAPVAQTRQTEPHSYFVTELFEKVIFPDQNLAMRSTTRVRRHVQRQILIGSAAVGTTMLMVLPSMVSYAKNRDLINETTTDVSRAQTLETSGQTADAVDMLLHRVQELEKVESDFKIPGYWGPRTAPELKQAAQALYLERLRVIVTGPIRDELTSNVEEIGNLVRVDVTNFKSSFDALKLYLMLTRPQHLQPEWASKRLAEVWCRVMNATDDATRLKAEAHSKRYVDALAKDTSWAWKPNEGAITRAQGRLAFQPLDELRYSWLVETAKDVPAIRPDKIFFGASAQYFDARENVEVPGLYTAAGWTKVRELLSNEDAQLDFEGWVLGRTDEQSEERGAAAAKLQSLYFERYVRAWVDFLNGIGVKAPENIRAAIDELRALTESEGPYVRLFKTLGDNARLDLGPTSLADKLLDKAGAKAAIAANSAISKVPGVDGGVDVPQREVSPVERHFDPLLRFAFGDTKGKADAAPSGLSQYIVQLTTLEVALSQLAEAKTEPTNEFAAELSRTAGAVQRLLSGLDARTRLIVEPILMNPIRGSRAGVFKADHAALSDRWKAEVWEIWNTKLAPRFPFAETAGDVSVPEFADFFRPQTGLIWKFFEKDLKDRLEKVGDKFVPKSAAEPVPFLPDALNCLNVAQEITEAIFGTAPEPKMQFGVNIHAAGSNISQITLKVDGVPINYRNEPQRWQPGQWPGTGAPKGAMLEVKGNGFKDEIPREGDFGLFRLLAAGNIKPAGAQVEGVPIFVGVWTLTRPGEPPVTIEFKPSKAVHPFARGFFKRMRCPNQLIFGAAPGVGQ